VVHGLCKDQDGLFESSLQRHCACGISVALCLDGCVNDVSMSRGARICDDLDTPNESRRCHCFGCLFGDDVVTPNRGRRHRFVSLDEKYSSLLAVVSDLRCFVSLVDEHVLSPCCKSNQLDV